MATALVLAFKTTEGRICNLKISKPRADVTRTEAEAVMNDIISKNVFVTTSGAALATIESIYLTATTKTELLA